MQKHVIAAFLLVTSTNAAYRKCATFTYNAPNGGGKANYLVDFHNPGVGALSNFAHDAWGAGHNDHYGVGKMLGGGRQWSYVTVHAGATLYFLKKKACSLCKSRDAYRTFPASPYAYKNDGGWYPQLDDVRCEFTSDDKKFVRVASVYEHHLHQNNGGKRLDLYNQCNKNAGWSDSCTQTHSMSAYAKNPLENKDKGWWERNASAIRTYSGWKCRLRKEYMWHWLCDNDGKMNVGSNMYWNFNNQFNDNFCDATCWRTSAGRRLQDGRADDEPALPESAAEGEVSAEEEMDFPEEAVPVEEEEVDILEEEVDFPNEAPLLPAGVTDEAHLIEAATRGTHTFEYDDGEGKLDEIEELPSVAEFWFSPDWAGERSWSVDGVEVREKSASAPKEGHDTEGGSSGSPALPARLEKLEADADEEAELEADAVEAEPVADEDEPGLDDEEGSATAVDLESEE